MSTPVGRQRETGATPSEGQREKPLGLTIMNTLTGRPSWWLHAPGGYLVAWAGAALADEEAAREAADRFLAKAHEARFEVYVDAGGKYRWRAWSRAVRVAESGEWFVSRSEAQRAADDVRLRASEAVSA